MVQGGLCLKRGFCQGCVLNFSFSAVKQHEWHTASSAAVLGLENSIVGLKAIGFVVHFCAYICVAVRGLECERPCCVMRVDGVSIRERSHREVFSSSKLLFSPHLSPTLKLQRIVGTRSSVHYVVINEALHENLTPMVPLCVRPLMAYLS